MDMTAPRTRRRDLARYAWTAINAVQFGFTVAWTAVLSCVVLSLHAITGNRTAALRMA